MRSTDNLFRPGTVGPQSFDHGVDCLHIVETHISWVFLTGKFAYKVKKPVHLEFVNFGTLELRRYFCGEELRLNKRMVPDLYIDVVPIGGDPHEPRFGVEPAFEYAVRMYQFDESDRLDRRIEDGRLVRSDMLELGEMLAAAHANVAVAAHDCSFGRIRSVVSPIADNYRQLLDVIDDPMIIERLHRLCQADIHRLRRLRSALTRRWHEGHIRECHGDLHLANLAKFRSRIVAFDCLEFDPALRWIDVMNEVAFPYMDLVDRDWHRLAFDFLNAYLEHCGDYAGLEVLDLYSTYRAMVRMKVTAISPGSANSGGQEELLRYLRCAERFAAEKQPSLVLMHGLSASGKTCIANDLLGELRAIRIRSDVERKRLAGLPRTASSGSAVEAGLYATSVSEATYRYLRDQSEIILRCGYNAIVDAACLKRWQRQLFVNLAVDAGVPFRIVDCTAPEPTLRQRIAKRQQASESVSEANQQVLDRQFETADALGADELAYTVSVDTSQPVRVEAIARQLTAP